MATLAFDSARYVGARIGIFDPSGVKVGRVSHLSNQELLVIAGEERWCAAWSMPSGSWEHVGLRSGRRGGAVADVAGDGQGRRGRRRSGGTLGGDGLDTRAEDRLQ